MFKTPILFLIFNREETTKIVFEKIREIKPFKLYIAADGPRDNYNDDINKCIQTREIINNIDWDCKVHKIFRDKNLGCGKSVSESISWFFDNEPEGIILEDDCLPDKTFFFFCEELLEKYRDDNRIFSILGNNPMGKNYISNSYSFSKYNLIWGWATWRRSWEKYSFEMSDWQLQKNKNILKEVFKFDYISQRSWRKHLDEVFNGNIDTWDYQWHFTNWKYKGLNCLPNVNLIKNIGLDGVSGTHVNNFKLLCNNTLNSISLPLKHPLQIVKDKKADKFIGKRRFCNSYRLYIVVAIMSRIDKIRRILKIVKFKI